MIFATPSLPDKYQYVIENIDVLRKDLRFATTDSINRWRGVLGRMAYARAIYNSNTIEGINVTLDDAMAAVDQEESLKPQDENWQALVGYREAMDYIIQLSKEPQAYAFSEGTILGLHFMMMKYDLSKNPGRWRPGAIFVTNTATGKRVYEGPDAQLVPALMAELITSLNTKNESHIIVRAAMAHLNLTMIHPFKDGNGRMARAIQTMVLAREGILSPVFSSIEEYVGRNVLDYYNVLAEVGQGAWHPDRDPLPWVKFSLTAHYHQAMTLLRRVQEMSRMVELLEHEIKQRKLNDRVQLALVDAALGFSVRNPTYRKLAEISDQVAKLDLQNLVNAGFLIPKGERRWRHYVASEHLKQLRGRSRLPKEEIDPFDDAMLDGRPRQADLPGLTTT